MRLSFDHLRCDVPCPIKLSHRKHMSEPSEAFGYSLHLLWQRWIQSESVVIHCAAGCGRTSLAAITFLLLTKALFDNAVRQVRSAGSDPDTEKQRDFLNLLATRHG